MEKLTTAKANELYRNEELEKLKEVLQANGEDILVLKANEIAFPFVNELGEEHFIKIVMSVPRGSRDGTPYDAYEQAEEYESKQKAKIEKAKEREEKKQKKIALDKKMREEKAKAKQEK